MHRRLTTFLATAATALSTLALAAPVRADEATDAPVAQDDKVTIGRFEPQVVDVLKNDTDPNGDPLEICRVRVPHGAPFVVDEVTLPIGEPLEFRHDEPAMIELLEVYPIDFRRTGTFEVTYWACDEDYLTPATLTVKVKRSPHLRVTKVPGRPGVLRFANPLGAPVVVLHGSPRADEPDGRFRLAAHGARRVRVQRTRIIYVAFKRRTGALVDIGVVRGIDLPGGTRPPAPVGTSGRAQDAWRRAAERS